MLKLLHCSPTHNYMQLWFMHSSSVFTKYKSHSSAHHNGSKNHPHDGRFTMMIGDGCVNLLVVSGGFAYFTLVDAYFLISIKWKYEYSNRLKANLVKPYIHRILYFAIIYELEFMVWIDRTCLWKVRTVYGIESSFLTVYTCPRVRHFYYEI